MGRIMIVDDDNYIRELVSTLLINEGFSIYEAKNGRVALQRFSEEIPDLCIIDIMTTEIRGEPML